MKRGKAAAAAILLAAISLAVWTGAATGKADEAGGDELSLVMGEQRVLDAAGIESFSESSKGVIEVKIPRDGRRMVVTAVRPGTTSLLLMERSGGQRTIVITVFARRPAVIEEEMSEILGDLGGIHFRRVGPRIFIDGTVPTEGDLVRLGQVAALYEGQVESLARVDPSAVRPRTNIRLDLTFIEMRRSATWGAGVRWPGQIGATGTLDMSWDLAGGTPAASYTVVDQALPSIEAAAHAGWVKIRKRATLVTTSGSNASYSAGGEVNVAVAGSQAAELRTISYGCTLNVLPHLDPAPGLLDLQVEAEVADLSETSQDVPGRTVSRVSTLVHLGLGQSIVLSGLDTESEGRTKSGLPGLSRIPIIGMLFGVHSGRKEKVDGIIAITPTVIDSPDRDEKRRLEQALADFEDYDG